MDLEQPRIDTVEGGRRLIDELDDAIIDLVQRRRAVSAQVQGLRRQDGVTGIQHARENEIVTRYGRELGTPGAELALLLLATCRGHREVSQVHAPVSPRTRR